MMSEGKDRVLGCVGTRVDWMVWRADIGRSWTDWTECATQTPVAALVKGLGFGGAWQGFEQRLHEHLLCLLRGNAY